MRLLPVTAQLLLVAIETGALGTLREHCDGGVRDQKQREGRSGEIGGDWREDRYREGRGAGVCLYGF